MDKETFRKQGYEIIDWITDYYENIETLPVLSQVKPNTIKNQLPDSPPLEAEGLSPIMKDLDEIILPGITHWQHPSFFAYFPSNTSPYSLWADMLTSAMNPQCMVWLTSPAGTELEEKVMCWLRDLIGLPKGFVGVIQDTASTATLCSILTARESYSDYQINKRGFSDEKFTLYASEQIHSSIDKAVRIAGLGSDNLRKIPVDENFAMIPEKLEQALQEDIAAGYQPLCIIAAIGTTGSTAIDPVEDIGHIAQKYKVWYHIDAAFAGTALILPEMQWMAQGAEMADSFVFNPHKWMLTNFDCSAYFIKDKKRLIDTFSITPEYLKTGTDNQVNNYRDWGIQLGRRFRALKLWFVLRGYGVKGVQEKIREHIRLGQWFKNQVLKNENFQLLAPVPLNAVCFHFCPPHVKDKEHINQLNERLMNELNRSGKIFLTHTKLNGVYTLRMVIAQTEVQQKHVEEAWSLIQDQAREVLKEMEEKI